MACNPNATALQGLGSSPGRTVGHSTSFLQGQMSLRRFIRENPILNRHLQGISPARKEFI
jgi:hypothetical protein